jgi:hypothetical protein
MAKFIGTPIRGTDFASVSDEAISAKVASDTHARIRIDAGGRLTWGSGSSSGDINLYRDSASVLATDDVFRATGGLVTLTSSGAPTESLPNGALAIDTTNHQFYFRSNSAWNIVQGGGGGGNATVLVQSTQPVDEDEGTLWLDTDTLILSIYYNNIWEPVSGESALSDLTDVSITSLQNGQILKYSSASASWYNEYEAPENVDGGAANAVYGGTIALSGGGAAG